MRDDRAVPVAPPAGDGVPSRAAALEARFAQIAATRMAGLAVLHPRLRVQALGFAADDRGGALGVLLTPWFMNLVWLPLGPGVETLPPGATRERRVGREVFPFVGAYEDGFGAYETCSLFSPMFEFADHDAARATAQAVLDTLRSAPPQDASTPDAPARASRRALLTGGRRSAGAAP